MSLIFYLHYRSPSPSRRRGHPYQHHDIGFSDTVSNVVEMVKETRHPRGYGHHARYPRGKQLLNPFNLLSFIELFLLIS